MYVLKLRTIFSCIEPGHKRTESNIAYFEEEIKKNPDLYNNYVEEDYRDHSEEHARYEELCRRPDPIVSHTFCVLSYNSLVLSRGEWPRTCEPIHNLLKLFSLKFVSNHDYLKVDHKFNRYALFTLFNPGTQSE